MLVFSINLLLKNTTPFLSSCGFDCRA
uniref:Uncharacterized protein n=1 Tax=Rhizophora mucronata TaxID=61149 RepID=A0A2P2PLC5_RHIMU